MERTPETWHCTNGPGIHCCDSQEFVEYYPLRTNSRESDDVLSKWGFNKKIRVCCYCGALYYPSNKGEPNHIDRQFGVHNSRN